MKRTGTLLAFMIGAMTIGDVALAAKSIMVDSTAGRRWGEVDINGLQSHELNLAGYYQIETLPVAAGMGFSLVNFTDRDFETAMGLESVDTSWGYDLTVEIKAWLPKSTSNLTFTPHIKYSHDLLSDYVVKGENDAQSLKSDIESSGYRVNVGATHEVSPTMSLVGELSIGTQNLKFKSRISPKVGRGGARNDTEKYSYDSKALLVGLNTTI